jgi:nicotinamidase/pyrazinamidase
LAAGLIPGKGTIMTSSLIVLLIDIQNGFARHDLSPQQGGSLYVPGGEHVGRRAAGLIHSCSDTIFVLSQDFHPAGHISFAATHGVAPFSDFRLRADPRGVYVADPQGALQQTAWPDHCVQGSESAWFVDEIMAALPPALCHALKTDLTSPLLTANGARNNRFYVIRKGMRHDLDSYGIATENDQIGTTAAPAVFASIAASLHEAGVSAARIALGGLATNFCVEFSHHDVYRYLLPELQRCQIDARVQLLTDLCAGIEVSTADGSWPDLAHAFSRMVSLGSAEATTADVLMTGLPANHV